MLDLVSDASGAEARVCNLRRIVCLLTAAALLNGSGAWAQTTSSSQNKYALLIGIDTYQPAGTKVQVPPGAEKKGRFATDLSFR